MSATMQANIHRPLFDGTREIHAIWFDLDLLGQAQARARVLAHWQAGARLHRVASGYLLTLATPAWVHCATLDGLALCRVGATLASAPLTPAERASMLPGGCYLVRGAKAHAYPLGASEQIDPWIWIDTSAIALRRPLAFPAEAPAPPLAPPAPAKSLRAILDHAIGPPSPEREQFMRAVAEGSAPQDAGRWRHAAATAGLVLAASAGLTAALIGKLAGRKAAPGTVVPGAAAPGGAGTAEDDARPRPASPLNQRLHAALVSLANLSRFSRLIGWRQANYLRKMMEMFDHGDIAEALRHAIPLGGESADARQALTAPRARNSLEITGPGATTSSINLEQGVQAYLRQRYRQLFERLAREGRVDEATYVLAELLNCGVEAVDYLEKNGRYRQAAQLAETLELPPAVAVRMWIKARDAGNAMRVARLTGAFAEAVRHLEQGGHAQAAPLRVLWAEYLADSGDLVGAADVLWPLEAQRGTALACLLKAEQGGYVLGMRALVRKLALLPEHLESSLPALVAILDDSGAEGPQRRASLASELHALATHSSATGRLTGELLRRVLPERQAGHNTLDAALLKQLLDRGDCAMLRSDMPALGFGAVPQRPLAAQSAPLQCRAGEVASMPIHDARRLPNGHYLLALGEAGVVRVSASGKQVAHFPVPCTDLVLATTGQRVLALARRGDVKRISQIDLATCKVADWISQAIQFWAPQYDGVVWNAVIDNRLVAIDTHQQTLSVIWQVADLPGRVTDLIDDGKAQVMLLDCGNELQQWRYDLPLRRMRQRESATPTEPGIIGVLVHPVQDSLVFLRCDPTETGMVLSASRADGSELGFAFDHGKSDLLAEICDGWLMASARQGDGYWICQVADRSIKQVVAVLRIDFADQPRVIAHQGHILVFDRAGRLLDVDCETGLVTSLSLHG